MVTKISDFLNTTFSTLTLNDAINNSVVYPGTIVHTTTGTPGSGIGAGLQFQVETSINNNETGMTLETLTTDVTAGSEDFDFIVKLMQNGAAAGERLRLNSAGQLTVLAGMVANSFTPNASTVPTNGMYLPAANTVGFSTNSGEKVRIDSLGNVGIGTTSPDSPLSIRGGTAMTFGWNRSVSLNATYPVLVFNSNNTKYSGMGVDFSVASAGLTFWTNGSTADISGTGIVAARISHLGNIALGDNAAEPPSKLVVISSSGAAPVNTTGSGAVRLRSTATAGVGVGPSLIFEGQTNNTTANYGFAAIQGFKSSATAADYSGSLAFYTQNAGGSTAFNERMRIDGNGSVGIATTTPGSVLDVNGIASFRSAISVASGVQAATLASNGAVSGTTGTFTGALYGASFNTAGTATVNALVSNGAVSGTTGTFTGALYGASFNTAGTATVNALVSNGSITGTNYLVTTASSTAASGAAIQRVFSKTVAATQLYKLAEYSSTEGVVAIEIQVASQTSANSGTTTYRFQGGYSSLTGSYYRLMPFNDGRGHGEGPDTGFSTLAWEVYIYGTTVSGGPTVYGVAVSVPTGAVTKTLFTTITELRRGMTFTDRSADAVVTSFTNSGIIYSHKNLLVESEIGIGTSNPLSVLDVRGGIGVTAASNFGGAVSVASLTSNGAISGTTGTFSSALYSTSFNTAGTATVNALVSNGAVSGTTGAFSGALTLTSAAPQISLNNGTSNWIAWNQNGVAAPAFTTRSAGTKLVLYPNIDASNADFAIGIDSSTLWQSVNTTASQFRWYGGTTQAMLLSGAGALTTTSTTTATAFVPSGSTVPTNGMYLPTTNTVGFSTNSVERMRITSTGNVVIGTSAAVTTQASLMVSGNTNNGAVALAALDAATISIKNDSVASLNLTSKLNFNVASIGASVVAGYYAVFNASNDIGTGLLFGTQTNAAGGTVERMRINESGQVGIGTTIPREYLHLNNPTAAGDTPRIKFTNTNTGGGVSDGGFIGISNQNQLDVWNNEASLVRIGTSGVERMRVDATGNVSIGTNLVGAASGGRISLTVNGTNGSLLALATGDTLRGYVFTDTSNMSATCMGGTMTVQTAAAQPVIFATNSTERMRIDSVGNVGIGTSTIQTGYKLQVEGDFAATSKSFVINHPTKPGMMLRYGSLESPYHGIRLTGEGEVIDGKCTIQLPEYTHALCKQEDAQVQLTNIKHGRTLWIDDIDIANNQFTVRTRGKGKYRFYWSFTAVRKDIEDMLVEFNKQ